MFGEWTETDCRTYHEISTMWQTKARTEPQKTSRLLMTSEEVTRPKPLKLYEDDDDDDDDAKLQTINFPTTQGSILINLSAASILL